MYLVEYYKNSDDQGLIGVFDSELLATMAKEEFVRKYQFAKSDRIFITPIEVNKMQEHIF
ncbi:hypothetical protein BN128_4722 [Cronobacter sakazakii 696]|nr:hypothetical protein BN128_4722 [Cronobacter sakazakii 696]